MLVFADRGFGGSYELFDLFAQSGAELCWRLESNAALPVLERLEDGSFRSELPKTAKRPTRDVRVVEYQIQDPGRKSAEDSTYRLLTTILEPERAPASELAARYAERWEFETALDELKTHQHGPRIVLRSKTADGVRQEAWGMLCLHYAIRALMVRAAEEGGVDPDRLSFTSSARAAKRTVRRALDATSTNALAVGEVLHHLLPRRRCDRTLVWCGGRWPTTGSSEPSSGAGPSPPFPSSRQSGSSALKLLVLYLDPSRGRRQGFPVNPNGDRQLMVDEPRSSTYH